MSRGLFPSDVLFRLGDAHKGLFNISHASSPVNSVQSLAAITWIVWFITILVNPGTWDWGSVFLSRWCYRGPSVWGPPGPSSSRSLAAPGHFPLPVPAPASWEMSACGGGVWRRKAALLHLHHQPFLPPSISTTLCGPGRNIAHH